MQRYFLGILALLLTIGGALMWMRDSHNSVHESALAAACLKVGPVLGAMWLAFPQVLQLLRRFPPALIAAIVIGFGTVIIRPRATAIVIPVILVILPLRFLGTLFKPIQKGPKPRA